MRRIFAIILLLLLAVLCALASAQKVTDRVDQDSVEEPTLPPVISTKANDTFIIENVMASNIDESTNDVITRSRIFSKNDSKAYSWLRLGKVGAGTVKWMWYSPDGNLYKTISVDIPARNGEYWPFYNVWSYIDITPDILSQMSGDWYVDVFLDGKKLFTEGFIIQGNQSPNEQTTANYWSDLGFDLNEQGKYGEAIQALDKAINIDPQDEAAWNEKGYALYKQGRYDEAIQALDKAIEINPQNAEVWYGKAEVLYDQRKYDEAIHALNKTIEINPQDALAWYFKGWILEDQGKKDEANSSYDKAIEIDPQVEDEWLWG